MSSKMGSKRAGGKALLELIELVAIAGFKGAEIIFQTYTRMQLTIARSTYHAKLKRFEKHGLIERKKTANGHVFVISAKAKQLRQKAIIKSPRTDGFASLAIFDIPEEKHNARDTFRRYLIKNGYTKLRESCFISPFQVSSDLKDLVHELKLEKNISFFSAKPEYYLNNE